MRTYDTNGKSAVAGTRCSLYNTTQQSVVSFVNNTGMISPTIISYHNPVYTIFSAPPGMHCLSLGSSPTPLFIYEVVGNWLFEQLLGTLVRWQMGVVDGIQEVWFNNNGSPFNLALQ